MAEFDTELDRKVSEKIALTISRLIARQITPDNAKLILEALLDAVAGLISKNVDETLCSALKELSKPDADIFPLLITTERGNAVMVDVRRETREVKIAIGGPTQSLRVVKYESINEALAGAAKFARELLSAGGKKCS